MLVLVALPALIAGHDELGVAIEIALRALELRLVSLSGRLCLIERGLERPRVDLKQRIAGFDVLALGEEYLGHLSVDAGADRDGVEGLRGADAADEYRHVLRLRHSGRDRDRGCSLRGFRGLRGLPLDGAPRQPSGPDGSGDQGSDDDPPHAQAPCCTQIRYSTGFGRGKFL